MLYAVQSFVNETLYEECAPLATFESAFKVISFEFEENIVNHQSFSGVLLPQQDAVAFSSDFATQNALIQSRSNTPGLLKTSGNMQTDA